jgi:serine phosphatase RsbU (regulator of sigma subunit)
MALTGEYAVANAGHIAPYLDGKEIETAPALPLGLVADQKYEAVRGRLATGERLVLLSDGVLEARSESGELYGFDRLSPLTRMPAQTIAETAQRFGQEDDITVLTLELAAR